MASRTTTRLVVAAVLIGAVVYFAPEALDKVGDFAGDLVGANDAVTMGEGETALMVAANAEAKLVNCETATILAEKTCMAANVTSIRWQVQPKEEPALEQRKYRLARTSVRGRPTASSTRRTASGSWW